MLPKKRRIERKVFPLILSQGKRYNSSHILLSVALQDEKLHPSRFSFSVSKKIARLAVDRNRIRRRGYSIVLKNLQSLSTGFLCFFTLKKGSYPLSFEDMEKEVLILLKVSGVLS